MIIESYRRNLEYIRNIINDKQTRVNQFLNSIEGNNPKPYQ